MGDLGGLNAGGVRLDFATGLEPSESDPRPPEVNLGDPGCGLTGAVVGETLPMTAATLVGGVILLMREGEGVDE